MLVRWMERPTESRRAWREVNRLFDETFGLANGAVAPNGGGWLPAVDVTEDEQAYRVALELPGVKASDVKVEVDGNRLTVSGEKKLEVDTATRSERRYGSFSRVFTLPETVDVGSIGARSQDGVLTITLPKVEKAKPRQIAVTAS